MNLKLSFLFLLLICLTLSQPYDLIFVGMGSASSITLSKLVKRFPQKSFLAVEMGGPTTAQIGGTDYPPYFDSQPASNKATISDVPGEYSNTPWNSQGEPYRISQVPWTWQGKGFGGNSQFNGMLYQEAPNDYLDSLPTGWKSGDLRPYFNEIRSKMTISTTPSTDGQTYLGGIHDVLASVFSTLGWTQQDTSNLGNLGKPGYYSRPYVASQGGKRAGPVSAYLSTVVGANGQSSASNLQIVPFAQVKRIIFSTTNTAQATGIVYTKDGSNTEITATLKAGGKVVCGAGALLTPRLLYLSGVGPSGKEGQVMDNPNVPFVRNNAKVGATLYDHVGTQLAFTYKGARPVQTIKYGDYAANQAYINQYVSSKSGPYAQYGPVSVAHAVSSASRPYPDFELFTNPSGPGGNDRFNGPKSFQIVSMFMRPRSNAVLGLDFVGDLRFPNLYFTNDADANDQTNAISLTLNNILNNKADFELLVGPGSQTNPNLNPTVFSDVKQYVTSGAGYDGVQGSRLIMNHWTGTVPLTAGTTESAGGVDPSTLRLRATSNVYVVDASLLPGSIPCHPIATIMAIGAKAADVIAAGITTDPTTSATPTPTSSSTSTTVTPPTSTSSSIPTSVYYSFDSAIVGGKVTDDSGNGRSGTIAGTPTLVTGKYGKGMQFVQTGALQTLQVANGNIFAGSFSVTFWLNFPTKINTLMKVCSAKNNWNDEQGWQLEINPSADTINLVGAGSTVASFTGIGLVYGSWLHVGVVVNGATVSLYLNGALSRTGTIRSISVGSSPLFVASNNKGNGFSGILDEFRISPAALTASQVQTLMNTNAGTPQTVPSSSATPTPTSSTTPRTSTSTSAASSTSSSATVAPTRSSTTATPPPSTSSGPAKCGAGFCGGSDQCCNGQCYNPANYVCTIDNKGTLVLCPTGNGSCNGQCYQTALYICTDSGLQPKPRR